MNWIIEEESGTETARSVHSQNGYYAGTSPRSRSSSAICARCSR
jgi:hypothetical protein